MALASKIVRKPLKLQISAQMCRLKLHDELAQDANTMCLCAASVFAARSSYRRQHRHCVSVIGDRQHTSKCTWRLLAAGWTDNILLSGAIFLHETRTMFLLYAWKKRKLSFKGGLALSHSPFRHFLGAFLYMCGLRSTDFDGITVAQLN